MFFLGKQESYNDFKISVMPLGATRLTHVLEYNVKCFSTLVCDRRFYHFCDLLL